MAGKFETPRGSGQPPRRRQRRRHRRISPLLRSASAAGILVIGLTRTMFGKKSDKKTGSTEPEVTETTETTVPEFSVTARATVASQGDLLMHATIFAKKWDGGCYMDVGTYNFDSLFRYISPYLSAADYAAANLETKL